MKSTEVRDDAGVDNPDRDRHSSPRLRLTSLARAFPSPDGIPLLSPRPPVQALAGVSLDVAPGETLAIVGESGSGKSTLGRIVAGLDRPDSGRVLFEESDATGLARGRGADVRRDIQIIFQNPHASLNPHHTVEEIVARPLQLYFGMRGQACRKRVVELLESVRLSERYAARLPRDLSGGEKQRVCIARAFAAKPRLVVCDEPTSALDISVQAAILHELAALQRRHGTACLFICHDLGVVRHIADRVAVMYLGRVVEIGRTEDVFAAPHHPYTEALIAAIPRIDVVTEARIRLRGSVPNAAQPPSGCVFHTRCPRKLDARCDTDAPPSRALPEGHELVCHRAVEELRQLQCG